MSNGIYLITGATGGIGYACAETIAARGDDVLLTDLDDELLQQAAQKLEHLQVNVETAVVDVVNDDHLLGVCRLVEERGGLAGCVHAAGIGGTMAAAQRVLEINLGGTRRLVQALLPLVKPGTAVVCIASQAAYFWAPGISVAACELLMEQPLTTERFARLEEALGVAAIDGTTAYGLSKYGVQQLVLEYTDSYGQSGARLISLSPGVIDTALASHEMKAFQEPMQMIIDKTPVGARKGLPQEVAAVAAFLCSPQASFISGIDVLVDGGSTHQVLRAK